MLDTKASCLNHWAAGSNSASLHQMSTVPQRDRGSQWCQGHQQLRPQLPGRTPPAQWNTRRSSPLCNSRYRQPREGQMSLICQRWREADLSSTPLETTLGRVSTELVIFAIEFPLRSTGTAGQVPLLGGLAGCLHLSLTEGEGQVAGVAPVLVGLGRTPVCLESIVWVVTVSEGIP